MEDIIAYTNFNVNCVVYNLYKIKQMYVLFRIIWKHGPLLLQK